MVQEGNIYAILYGKVMASAQQTTSGPWQHPQVQESGNFGNKLYRNT